MEEIEAAVDEDANAAPASGVGGVAKKHALDEIQRSAKTRTKKSNVRADHSADFLYGDDGLPA